MLDRLLQTTRSNLFLKVRHLQHDRFALIKRRIYTMTVDTHARVQALRKEMATQDLSYYCVPSEDAHASEYTAACDERRAYISGFDGSAGIAIVGLKKCYLFTDGRYFNQAAQQIDDNWELMKQGLPNVPT